MDHLPLSDIPMLVSSINFLLRDEIFDNLTRFAIALTWSVKKWTGCMPAMVTPITVNKGFEGFMPNVIPPFSLSRALREVFRPSASPMAQRQ